MISLQSLSFYDEDVSFSLPGKETMLLSVRRFDRLHPEISGNKWFKLQDWLSDMSDEEVDATFAKAMAAGDEEPEIGDIEKADVSAAKMSDADYEAFMKVSDLENRLASTKSNILKIKKSKGVAGDIGDKPSTELVRLRDLKASLEKRIDDLVAGSEYLQKRQTKLTGKEYTKQPPEEINIADEEPLDEWTMNRMQYYAGIKK
jgi:hypothetical protein